MRRSPLSARIYFFTWTSGKFNVAEATHGNTKKAIGNFHLNHFDAIDGYGGVLVKILLGQELRRTASLAA